MYDYKCSYGVNHKPRMIDPADPTTGPKRHDCGTPCNRPSMGRKPQVDSHDIVDAVRLCCIICQFTCEARLYSYHHRSLSGDDRNLLILLTWSISAMHDSLHRL